MLLSTRDQPKGPLPHPVPAHLDDGDGTVAQATSPILAGADAGADGGCLHTSTVKEGRKGGRGVVLRCAGVVGSKSPTPPGWLTYAPVPPSQMMLALVLEEAAAVPSPASQRRAGGAAFCLLRARSICGYAVWSVWSVWSV